MCIRDRNKIVFSDTSNRRAFNRFKSFGIQRFGGTGNIVVILTTKDPTGYELNIKSKIISSPYKNVVAMIPGKRTDEFVVFSGHYDHLGIGKPLNGDTIYN